VSVEPYYSDDFATIYHGDCREVLPHLNFDVIVSDPPYGVQVQTNYNERKRGGLTRSNDWGASIAGDDRPFDPVHLLEFQKPTVLFGGNHYADRLPPSPTWLVWDKVAGMKSRREIGFNDQADVEIAWSNCGGPARLFSFLWMGAMTEGRREFATRQHPTEKPVPLMAWVLKQVPLGTVVDPYMGSGSTLRAAKDLGRKCIGIELEERYCEVAVRRLAQEVLPL